MNLTDVETACAQSEFDLVILGQSLPDQEKWRLETTIRKHCKNARMLEMYKVAPVTSADMHWDTAGSPAEFEREIRRLVYRGTSA